MEEIAGQISYACGGLLVCARTPGWCSSGDAEAELGKGGRMLLLAWANEVELLSPLCGCCFDEAHIHFIGVLEEKLVLEQALRQHLSEAIIF